MRKSPRSAQDTLIFDIVKGILLSDAFFRDLFRQYKAGQLHFADVSRWVDDKGHSLLYNLKEKCHVLFRHLRVGNGQGKEWLLDLAVGSIFHEAIKLRENVYQLEAYRPRYLTYQSNVGPSTYERDYLHQFGKILKRAEQGVAEGMEETRSLFRDAEAQLFDVLKEQAKNPYLARFLLENLPLLRKVYGSKITQEMFHLLFRGGLQGAYVMAGLSYLQSHHYEDAILPFSKASSIDHSNRELEFLLNFSRGMAAYYQNAHRKALSCFTRLKPSQVRQKWKRTYLKKVDEVCLKIASEMKEENKHPLAQKARSLAERIKKWYEK